MKEALLFLGGTLLLIVGALVGHAVAVSDIHREAVANGVGRWVPVTGYSSEFVWVQPRE